MVCIGSSCLHPFPAIPPSFLAIDIAVYSPGSLAYSTSIFARVTNLYARRIYRATFWPSYARRAHMAEPGSYFCRPVHFARSFDKCSYLSTG